MTLGYLLAPFDVAAAHLIVWATLYQAKACAQGAARLRERRQRACWLCQIKPACYYYHREVHEDKGA